MGEFGDLARNAPQPDGLRCRGHLPIALAVARASGLAFGCSVLPRHTRRSRRLLDGGLVIPNQAELESGLAAANPRRDSTPDRPLGGHHCECDNRSDLATVAAAWPMMFPMAWNHRGYAYGFDVGIFCCIKVADGKRSWKDGRYGRGQVMVLADQDVLLVTSETGELVLLAADSNERRELGKFQALDGKTWNHPVVWGDRVYLRNAEQMGCYAIPAKAVDLAIQD